MYPIYVKDDRVMYMGRKGTVRWGNEPSVEWTGHDSPISTVNIILDNPTHGISRQLDVYVTSLIRL